MCPERAAVFLVVEGDRAAFVDNNTTLAIPHLLAALAARGMTPDQWESLGAYMQFDRRIYEQQGAGLGQIRRAPPHEALDGVEGGAGIVDRRLARCAGRGLLP